MLNEELSNDEKSVDDKNFELKRHRLTRLWKFALVSTVGLGINQLIVFIGIKLLSLIKEQDPLFILPLFNWQKIDIDKVVVAEFFAIIVVTLYNYIVNKIWTFREVEQVAEFNTLVQFIKFAIVGASGTIVNLGLVYVFATLAGWNDYLATAIGFTVSVFTNFILNDIWTFNPKFSKKKNL
ncbi:MAG: GtrA family protein [Candidatus Heimdallarchaeaceae archaeon]